MSEQYYGFFSAAHKAAGHSTSIYSTPDGGEIEVSHVVKDPSYRNGWEDMVLVGPVERWLRKGQESKYFVPSPEFISRSSGRP